MKPRTKLQHQVLNLSDYHLCDIKEKVLSWAKVEILDHKGFATKTRVICMDCGGTFSPTLANRNRAVCPHCSAKLKIELTKRRTYQHIAYIAYAEICGEFQVIRNFEISSFHKSGKPADHIIKELLQHWVLPNGKREVVARNHRVNWYCDSWNGNMEIRDKRSNKKYEIYPQKYHPNSIFKPEYKKYGINEKLEGITFLEACNLIPYNSKAETLLKAKRYDLLSCFNHHNLKYKISEYWPSIKICLRSKYKIDDLIIWFDYLDLLKHFNKDLRNAFYVCPKNLKKEHDKLERKKRVERERQEFEAKRKKMLEDATVFNKLKSKFFGISFSDGSLKVSVIDSLEEMMKEGDILKHCVFTNEYYSRPDSLILSATVDGNRTETVEVCLKELKVIQCRGMQNENTSYHDQIISLVNKNMHFIKERLKPKRKKDGIKKNVTAAA